MPSRINQDTSLNGKWKFVVAIHDIRWDVRWEELRTFVVDEGDLIRYKL